MTTKRKAPAPKATGAPPENPTLESLAEQLRALGVDPGWVLYAALEGEKVARRAPSGARLRSLRSLEEEQAQFRTPEEERERLHRLEEEHRSLLREGLPDAVPGLSSPEEVESFLQAVKEGRRPAFEERRRSLEEGIAEQGRRCKRVDEIRQEIALLKVVVALEADPRALYAPSVLEAIVQAAIRCRMPAFGGKFDAEGLLTDVSVSSTTKAQAVILAASFALRSEGPAIAGARSMLSVTDVLRLARQVEAEAERLARSRPATFARSDGRPSVSAVAKARANVSMNAGLSVDAMQLRIRRAAEAHPDAGWPELMPRPPKNRRT